MIRPFARAIFLAALGSVCLPAAAPTQEKAAPKVMSLEVYKMAPPGVDQNLGSFANSTTLGILLPVAPKNALTIDTKASTLKSATDDKGTDLTKPLRQGDFAPPWINDYAIQVSKDKQYLSVRMSFPNVPTAGAAKINVKANLAVVCGTEEKTAEVKDVELGSDKTTKVGALILSYDKNGSFGDTMRISFTCEDAPRVKSVTFLDKDGQALMSTAQGIGRNFGGGRNDWVCYYSLQGKIDKATVRVIYYEKTEVVNVPLDLEVGVGF
jgi:hypothetical protein